MSTPINLIEPLLISETGHYYSFVRSLCEASKNDEIIIWANRKASVNFHQSNILLKSHFYYKLRRIQSLILVFRLLKKREKIFFSTAGTTELLLVYLAARKPVHENSVYLYVHYVKKRREKMDFYKKAAKKHPNIVTFGPTRSVVGFLTECGFKNVRLTPYPIYKPHQASEVSVSFDHIVFAGSSSRKEKGFPYVVDFVQFLNQNKSNFPVILQLREDLDYPEDTLPHAKRLLGFNYPHLKILPAELSSSDYYNMYAGGICLQLYDKVNFADRVSGVTLDALVAGCPIVALSGSWIARMVKKYNAGIIVETPDPVIVNSAVEKIVTDYMSYQGNAAKGGRILAKENNASHLLNILTR